jgi:hypothetical protein
MGAVMKAFRFSVLVCLACLVGTSRVEAQVDILTDLAKNFSDLAIQWGPFIPNSGRIHPESGEHESWLGSFGAEFIFDIKKLSTADPSPKGCEKILVTGEQKERQIKSTTAGKEVIDIYNMKNACDEREPNLELELGVGFFQTSRFVINRPAGSVTGTFREAPSVSVYATWLRHTRLAHPYAALRGGVTELVSLSLSDASGKSFSATTPRSVEIGGVLGAYREIGNLPASFFTEVSWMYRPIAGIEWGVNKDDEKNPIPAPINAPKSFDFTGWTFGVGIQIQVKDPTKKE